MTDSVHAASGLLVRNPDDLFDPAPLGYSHLAVAPSGARLVWIAGQAGGPDKGSFADQTRVALANVGAAMRAAGGDIGGVAKLTVYIVDHDDAKHGTLIRAVDEAFGERLAPACTIVPLQRLGTSPDMLVEIEAFGILPRDTGR